jgi:hypothetical protein
MQNFSEIYQTRGNKGEIIKEINKQDICWMQKVFWRAGLDGRHAERNVRAESGWDFHRMLPMASCFEISEWVSPVTAL